MAKRSPSDHPHRLPPPCHSRRAPSPREASVSRNIDSDHVFCPAGVFSTVRGSGRCSCAPRPTVTSSGTSSNAGLDMPILVQRAAAGRWPGQTDQPNLTGRRARASGGRDRRRAESGAGHAPHPCTACSVSFSRGESGLHTSSREPPFCFIPTPDCRQGIPLPPPRTDEVDDFPKVFARDGVLRPCDWMGRVSETRALGGRGGRRLGLAAPRGPSAAARRLLTLSTAASPAGR